MKGGQSREVGSKESHREGVEERNKGGECKGRLIRVFFGGAEMFAYSVKVAEGNG